MESHHINQICTKLCEIRICNHFNWNGRLPENLSQVLAVDEHYRNISDADLMEEIENIRGTKGFEFISCDDVEDEKILHEIRCTVLDGCDTWINLFNRSNCFSLNYGGAQC